jgi:hypothetical protein
MEISDWVNLSLDIQVQDDTGIVDISLFRIDAIIRD